MSNTYFSFDVEREILNSLSKELSDKMNYCIVWFNDSGITRYAYFGIRTQIDESLGDRFMATIDKYGSDIKEMSEAEFAQLNPSGDRQFAELGSGDYRSVISRLWNIKFS